ncbi:MAG: hypothetical protein LBS62_02960 [Clostridiales bacterium]|nr:hypothetical protein [Clostridiales bacterium]
MLTQIFYYNYYKPYLIDGYGSKRTETPRRPKILENMYFDARKDSTFLLNKTLRSDVVHYINDISSNVNGVKESSKNVMFDMEGFNNNVYRCGEQTARKWLTEDLSKFAGEYNKAVVFFETQEHSAALKDFALSLREKTETNNSRLHYVGISLDAHDSLDFDKKYFSGLNQDSINIAIGETVDFFNLIYSESGDILKAPLTDHMQFKFLGYYYNYKYGTYETDTFKVIETGMVVDKAI